MAGEGEDRRAGTPGPRLGWRDRLRGIDRRALVAALVVGTVGGALFARLGLPLAWMIGAMSFTTGAALASRRVSWLTVKVPPGLRGFMVMILGIMLGSRFEPALLATLDRWVVSLAALLPYIALCIAIGHVYLRRVAGYDPVTAYFTATPGGLSEMVLVGGSLGGDERAIALSHSARIMIVVFTVPVWFRLVADIEGTSGTGALGPALGAVPPADLALLAACAIGAPIARRLRIPAAVLVGPMVLSAAIHLAGVTGGSPPGVLVAAAQVVVGAAIGARFADATPAALLRIAAVAAGLTVLLVAVALAFALGLHAVTGIPLAALILAYAPGGLAEMSLIALALDVDAAFVSTHHVVRIIVIVTLAPVVFGLIGRRAPAKQGPDDEG
ncbi:MAG: AbrB family transcriptional regulator [Azospirillaceae bacterium]